MRFENPNILWLLLVLPPALVAFFWWSWRERQRLVTQFIDARLLPALLSGYSPARRKLRLACLGGAITLLIVALARPQWGFNWEETKLRGLDIVVAIDVSKSMLAEDIAPNRLGRAKLAALDLMQQAKSDRLGLVAFAGGVFLQCPLTADDTAFRQSVEALDVNTIPQGGTAIAEAINITYTVFKEGDSHKVLVLLTDGEDNDEGALDAAKNAAKEGLKIFTIGIGTPEGELLHITDGQGHSDYIRDAGGNVVKSHLNEKLLQDIARESGGFYMPLRGAKTIDTLYEKGLAAMPKAEQSAKLVKRWHERYHWPLGAAILLLLLEMFWPEQKRTDKKTANAQSPAIMALVVFLLLPAATNASPKGAWKDFIAGRFAVAQAEYEQLAEKDKTGDLRLLFNAGTAAYRGTNYDAAIQHFTSVLAARDVKLQQAAYFNLGNTHYRIGEQAKDLDGMQESWETAIKAYQNAVALDKNDRDATYNLAFTQRNVEQIVQLREAARRAKEAADDATRKRNYHLAVEIMDDLLQRNPTAKQFQDFAKKLKDIDAIATPHQP